LHAPRNVATGRPCQGLQTAGLETLRVIFQPEPRGQRVVLVYDQHDRIVRGIHRAGPADELEVPRRRRGEIQSRVGQIKTGWRTDTSAQRRIDGQAKVSFGGRKDVLQTDVAKGAAVAVDGDVIDLVRHDCCRQLTVITLWNGIVVVRNQGEI